MRPRKNPMAKINDNNKRCSRRILNPPFLSYYKLIQKGAKMQIKVKRLFSPYSVLKTHSEVFQSQFFQGSASDDLTDRLVLAARRNDAVGVKKLIDSGAHILGKPNDIPPLFWALYNKNEDMCQMFINLMSIEELEQFQPTIGSNFLIFAVIQENVGIVEKMLQKGVDPYLKDDKGHDAYRWASMSRNVKMMALLNKYSLMCWNCSIF